MSPRLSPKTLNVFCDSFERVKSNLNFLDLFYEKFLGSSSEVTRLFEGVSISRLKKMLWVTLYLPMLASDGNTTAVDRLLKLGTLHSDKGVMEHHYKLWLDSLISTVKECDVHYSMEVDMAWRQLMEFGIEIMLGRSELVAAPR